MGRFSSQKTQESLADAKISACATVVRVWRPLAKKSTANQ